MERGSLGSSEGVDLGWVLEGGSFAMRLYFVLLALGAVSAAISERKDCSSCSASSSRVGGFEGVEVDGDVEEAAASGMD